MVLWSRCRDVCLNWKEKPWFDRKGRNKRKKYIGANEYNEWEVTKVIDYMAQRWAKRVNKSQVAEEDDQWEGKIKGEENEDKRQKTEQ